MILDKLQILKKSPLHKELSRRIALTYPGASPGGSEGRGLVYTVLGHEGFWDIALWAMILLPFEGMPDTRYPAELPYFLRRKVKRRDGNAVPAKFKLFRHY